jgi:hypothetical protein
MARAGLDIQALTTPAPGWISMGYVRATGMTSSPTRCLEVVVKPPRRVAEGKTPPVANPAWSERRHPRPSSTPPATLE